MLDLLLFGEAAELLLPTNGVCQEPGEHAGGFDDPELLAVDPQERVFQVQPDLLFGALLALNGTLGIGEGCAMLLGSDLGATEVVHGAAQVHVPCIGLANRLAPLTPLC